MSDEDYDSEASGSSYEEVSKAANTHHFDEGLLKETSV